MTVRTKAIFLQIDAPNRLPDIHWQASLYLDDGSELPFPVAIAWLSNYSDSPMEDMRMVLLDFLLVPDQCRRQGHGTALIAACRERWPNLELTDAISPSGEGLLRALENGTK